MLPSLRLKLWSELLYLSPPSLTFDMGGHLAGIQVLARTLPDMTNHILLQSRCIFVRCGSQSLRNAVSHYPPKLGSAYLTPPKPSPPSTRRCITVECTALHIRLPTIPSDSSPTFPSSSPYLGPHPKILLQTHACALPPLDRFYISLVSSQEIASAYNLLSHKILHHTRILLRKHR